ncbi:hypothetical protein M9458_007436, partial [Cirrhinus mrigala]
DIIPLELAELAADTTEEDKLATSTCQKRRSRKALADQTQAPSSVVQKDTDLNALYPEVLDDPTLVPSPAVPEVSSPVTFSKPPTRHVMPSETVSAYPVTLPEASCQFMPVVMAKEALPKPASEDDISVKPVSVTPDPVKPIPLTSDTVKPASVSPEPVQSAPVIPKSESTSAFPESATFSTVIQEQVVSTTVITQSMKVTPGISESAKSTYVVKESTRCTPVTQESVKSNVISQSTRSVPNLSQSTGSIPISAEKTKAAASPPVLAELATDTIKAVKHAASIHQKCRKMACTVQSKTLPVLSTEAMLMNPVLSKDCVLASHVISTKAFLEQAATPVMATEANAEAFILPVPATEVSSKQPVFPVTSKDAILTSHVKSKNAPASIKSTEVTLPSHTLATTVKHPSNQNPNRHIFKSESHRDMGVGLYQSYCQAAFGVSSLAAPNPLPSDKTV